MSTKKPNPGSDEALKQGCRCPVLDNNHGQGLPPYKGKGGNVFWMTMDCPLHGDPRALDVRSKKVKK